MLAEQSPSAVLGEIFRANDPREQAPVPKILFNRAQRFQVAENWTCARVDIHNRRFLEINFKYCMSLIQLRSSCEITQSEKKSGDNAQGNNPDPLQERMPQLSQIKALPLFKSIRRWCR